METTQTVGVTPAPTTTKLYFKDVIGAVIQGKEIRRKSWPEGEYGYLDISESPYLMIFREAEHTWLVNDGDITGDDWEIIN